MKPVVLVTAAIPKDGLEALFAQCEVVYPEKGTFTPEEMMRLAPEVDAVLACGSMDAAWIGAAKKLRVVSNYGVGYDRVDVAALTAAGIPLTNLPDETAGPTAELAMALLLALRRRIAELDRRVRIEAPERAFGMGRFMGHSVAGTTLGIVGMGNIGRKVRDMALAFGMRVVYHNRTALPRTLAGEAAWMPLEDVLATSDAVTLHCPLTPQTQGLIGTGELARMQPSAVLINTARGAVVDHPALIAALQEGRIAGAALDVYPDEPHIPEALRSLDHVVLTPHIGTNTVADRRKMCAKAAQNILDVLAGKRPERVVNPEAYQSR